MQLTDTGCVNNVYKSCVHWFNTPLYTAHSNIQGLDMLMCKDGLFPAALK